MFITAVIYFLVTLERYEKHKNYILHSISCQQNPLNATRWAFKAVIYDSVKQKSHSR